MRSLPGNGRGGRSAAPLLAAALLSSPGAGQELRVNDFTSTDQGLYSIARAPDGSTWVGWSSSDEFCTFYESVFRGISFPGTFLGSESPVAESCPHSGQQTSIAISASGDLAVAWTSNETYVRLFSASGVPLTGDVQVSLPAGVTTNPSVAVRPGGGYVVVWNRGLTAVVYSRVVLPDGSTPGPEVEIGEPSPYWLHLPQVASLASGRVVVAWLERRGNGQDRVMGRFCDADLAPLGSSMALSEAPGNFTSGLSLASHDSTYAVAWAPDSVDTKVAIRLFDETSGPLTSETVVGDAPGIEGFPSVAMDAGGGVIVTYDELPIPSVLKVMGVRLDASGAVRGVPFPVSPSEGGASEVAASPSGDFVAAYTIIGPDGTGDAIARRFAFPISVAVAPGPGAVNAPAATACRPDGSPGLPAFLPYPATGGYGAYLGAGAVDADGLDELLTGPGPSPAYGPHVRAFEANGAAIAKVSFYAYGTLKYGVKPGTANLDLDPYDEIVTTPGQGPVFGPHVRGFGYDGATLQPLPGVSFFAYGTLKYGANASAGDVEEDGYDELLTMPGPGPVFGANLRGFDVDGGSARSIPAINTLVYTTKLGGTVAAFDYHSDGAGSYRDAADAIAVGRGPGPANDAALRLLFYDGVLLQPLMDVPAVYPSMYGLSLAGGDVDAGDAEELVTAPGPDPSAASRVISWEWSPPLGYQDSTADLVVVGPDDFVAYGSATYGANVAVGSFE